MQAAEEKTQLNLKMPTELVLKIKIHALRQSKSVTSIVQEIFEDYFKGVSKDGVGYLETRSTPYWHSTEEKTQLTLRFSTELALKLKFFALRQHRSMTSVVQEVFEDFFKCDSQNESELIDWQTARRALSPEQQTFCERFGIDD